MWGNIPGTGRRQRAAVATARGSLNHGLSDLVIIAGLAAVQSRSASIWQQLALLANIVPSPGPKHTAQSSDPSFSPIAKHDQLPTRSRTLRDVIQPAAALHGLPAPPANKAASAKGRCAQPRGNNPTTERDTANASRNGNSTREGYNTGGGDGTGEADGKGKGCGNLVGPACASWDPWRIRASDFGHPAATLDELQKFVSDTEDATQTAWLIQWGTDQERLQLEEIVMGSKYTSILAVAHLGGASESPDTKPNGDE